MKFIVMSFFFSVTDSLPCFCLGLPFVSFTQPGDERLPPHDMLKLDPNPHFFLGGGGVE